MNKCLFVTIFIAFYCFFSNAQCYEHLEKLAFSSEILSKTMDEKEAQVVYLDTLILSTKFNNNPEIIEFNVENINEPDVYTSISFYQDFSSKQIFIPQSYERFKDDFYDGLIILSDSRNIYKKSFYKNGKKEGVEIWYKVDQSDTSVIFISEYKEGIKDGSEYWFYSNNKIEKHFQNKKGKPNGIETNYYKNGIIKSKGRNKGYFWYVRNKKSLEFGWHINDFNNWVKSQKVDSGTYIGIPEYLPHDYSKIYGGDQYPKRKGKWRFYDECGNLLEEKEYDENGFSK